MDARARGLVWCTAAAVAAGAGGAARADDVAPPAALVVEAAGPEPGPVFNHGVWLRIGTLAQNQLGGARPDQLSQAATVQVMLNGHLDRNLGWQADLRGAYGGGQMTTDVRVLDLIAKLESSGGAANLWVGRMLVPSDRQNLAGPWFVTTWLDAGQLGAGVPAASPHQGETGRNDGATMWGQSPRGTLKYFAGAYGLHQPGADLLWNARVVCSLIHPEPGYYSDALYYGEDRLALEGAVQFQHEGSVAVPPPAGGPPARDDYLGASSDVLYEKTLRAGILDVEAAGYRYWGAYEPFRWNAYQVASFLILAAAGPGRLQPVARAQEAGPRQAGAETGFAWDVQVNYVVLRTAFKASLGFQRARLLGVDTNTAFAGLQFVQ